MCKSRKRHFSYPFGKSKSVVFSMEKCGCIKFCDFRPKRIFANYCHFQMRKDLLRVLKIKLNQCWSKPIEVLSKSLVVRSKPIEDHSKPIEVYRSHSKIYIFIGLWLTLIGSIDHFDWSSIDFDWTSIGFDWVRSFRLKIEFDWLRLTSPG